MKKSPFFAAILVLLLPCPAALSGTLTVVDAAKDPAVVKTGAWESVTAQGVTYLASGTPGDRLRLEFTGVSVAVVFGERPTGGKCVIRLDGAPVKDLAPLDTRRRCDRPNDFLVARALRDAKHTLEITVAGDNPAGTKVFVGAIKHGDFAFAGLSGGVHPPVAVAKTHYPAVGVKVEAWRGGKAVMSAVSADPSDFDGTSPSRKGDAPGWRMFGLEPGRYTLTAARHPGWPLAQTVDVDVPAGGDATVDLRVLNRRLWSPRATCPAFALKGGAFECLVFVSPEARDWSATMTTGFKAYSLTVTPGGYDAALGLRRLQVRVPADAESELYELTIRCSEGTDTEPRCVKVLGEFRKRFTLAHLTDLHVGGDPVIDACFEKEIAEINLLRPEFVIVTGDCAHLGQDAMEAQFLEKLDRIDVPTFVTPGNHDWFTGLCRDATTTRWTGPPTLSFDYGDVHVALYDDGYTHYEKLLKIGAGLVDDEEKTWLKADLDQHRASALRIVAAHIGRASWPSLYRDLDEAGVGLFLYGHAHMDSVERFGRTPLLAVQTRSNQVVNKGMGPGYRLVGIEDGKVAFLAYDGEKVNAMPVPQTADVNDHALRVSFSGPNDGTGNGLVATITNGYDQRFEDVRVKFVVAKDVYAALGGRVVERYTSDDGRASVVHVSCDVPAKARGVKVRLIALHPQ